jgi:tetratricopeptide (TPR) repeat protein
MAYAQDDSKKDKEAKRIDELFDKSIKLVDEGKYAEGIKGFEECHKVYPDTFIYLYEIGYAYYAQKEYQKALKSMDGILNCPDVNDRVYKQLGDIYDDLAQFEKAMEMYDLGLKRFPNSGGLYLEKGVAFLKKKDISTAITMFEKGIEVQPKMASNYFRAANVYFETTDGVWGLLYGEILMNLERNTKRTDDTSKLLFEAYKNAIDFTNPAAIFCKFSDQKRKAIALENGGAKEQLPFDILYDFSMATCVAIESPKKIEINVLNRIRTLFIKSYFEKESNKTYPNILFDFHDKMIKAGHFEAYNYWLFRKGDEAAFAIWLKANKEKYASFEKWFEANHLQIDEKNRFYRFQYSNDKTK